MAGYRRLRSRITKTAFALFLAFLLWIAWELYHIHAARHEIEEKIEELE